MRLKPLHFLPSLLYFGLPALLFVAGFWLLMPWLMAQGMLAYYAYLLGLGMPLVLLLLLSLTWLRIEGRRINWHTLATRFRLRSMDRKAWLWSLGALLLGSMLGYGLMSVVSGFLIRQGILSIPSTVPEFMDPTAVTNPMVAYNEAVGGLRGNWLPFVAMVSVLVFNILGEEFW